MEVLLKKDVDKLGESGDIVTVKNGFGRNYLIPQGYAELATVSVKKRNAKVIAKKAALDAERLAQAKANAEKLAKTPVKVGAKVGENGRIFGSVTTVQVADALKNAGYDIERKDIKINEEPIKSIGTYTADVKLHKEVNATIKFEVVEE